MKYKVIVVILFMSVFLSLFFVKDLFLYLLNKKDQSVKQKNFKELVGVYVLDTLRTDLSNYRDQKIEFSTLTLSLFNDSTFILNFNVPFIYDSSGRWNAKGNSIEETNRMIFKRNPKIGVQFSKIYLDKKDSVLYLISTTPQQDAFPIQRIYFMKNQKIE